MTTVKKECDKCGDTAWYELCWWSESGKPSEYYCEKHVPSIYFINDSDGLPKY